MTEPTPPIPDPPRHMLTKPEELAAWRRVWPRVSAVAGFRPERDHGAVAFLVDRYLESERHAGTPDSEQYLMEARGMAGRLGLPHSDAELRRLFEA